MGRKVEIAFMVFLATFLIIVGTILVSTNVVPGVMNSLNNCRTPEAGIVIPDDHPSLKIDENGCILGKEEKIKR